MACKTCDHTMQRVNEGANPRVFWCPRCGTIKSGEQMPQFEQPKLAKAVVDFLVWDDNMPLGDRCGDEDYAKFIRTAREMVHNEVS